MKDYEIYNNYHRWVDMGENVSKEAYIEIMKYKPVEEVLAEQILSQINIIKEQ